MNKHIFIVGPSASGKSTLLDMLQKAGLEVVVPYTTRPARMGEVYGKDYKFLSNEDFNDAYADNLFISVKSYITEKGIWKYGLAWEDMYNDISTATIIDPFTYLEVRSRVDNVYGIYMDANDTVLQWRLMQRGDDIHEVHRRLESDKKDFKIFKTAWSSVYDYHIYTSANETVKDLTSDVQYILKDIGFASKTYPIMK